MKLYTVRYEGEIVVLAEDQAEATKIALGYDLQRDMMSSDDFGIESVTPMSYLPGGWDLDAIPYGHHDPDDPDRTLGEWIDAGAAPDYLESKKRLAGLTAAAQRVREQVSEPVLEQQAGSQDKEPDNG